MLRLFRFLFVRSAFFIDVNRSSEDTAAELESRVDLASPTAELVDRDFAGVVSESRFIMRYVGACSGAESRSAIKISGRLEPRDDGTRITVSMRHGLHLVLFSGILALLGTILIIVLFELTRQGKANVTLALSTVGMIGGSFWWNYRLRQELKAVELELQQLLRNLVIAQPVSLDREPAGPLMSSHEVSVTAAIDDPQATWLMADVTVTGRKPKLTEVLAPLLMVGLIIFAIAPTIEKIDFRILPLVMVVLFSCIGIVVRLQSFKRPPQASIEAGAFTLRLLPNQVVTTSAENVAGIDLRGGRMTVAFRSVQAIQPAKAHAVYQECFRKHGYHVTSGQGIFSLEQVNQLRAALGKPGQPADLFAEIESLLDRLTPRVFVTRALIASNVLVFLAMAVSGAGVFSPNHDTMMKWGANFGPQTSHGEWWRLFSSMFLHFGLFHLLVNMYVLRNVGRTVERLVGNTGFLIGYLTSGFFGGVASAGWHEAAVSAGASGAVFGVFGMLLGFVVGRQESLPTEWFKEHRSTAVMFLFFNLVLGWGAQGIDQAAHLGGFVAGTVCGLVLRCNLAAAANQRRFRNLALAAVAGGLGVMAVFVLASKTPGLSAIAAEIDKVDAMAAQRYIAAFERQQGGQQTAAESGLAVTKTIVPLYVDLARKSEHIAPRSGDPRERWRSKLTDYVRLRREGWELLGQSLTTNDMVSEGWAELRFESARKLLAEINPAVNNQQSRPAIEIRSEVAVFAVSEQQAVQSYEKFWEQFNRGELNGAQLADHIERDVLNVWQAGQKRFAGAVRQFPPAQQPSAARFETYLELQGAAWQLEIEGLRQNDQNKIATSRQKFAEAQAAAKLIWQQPAGTEN